MKNKFGLGGRVMCAGAFAALLLLNPRFVSAAGPEAGKVITKLESSKQRLVTLPKIDKGKLPGGLRYYILPDHELPIVKVIVYIRGGAIFDPAGQSGLAAVTARLLRSGGTLSLKPEEVDAHLDRMASKIEINGSNEYFIATLVSTTEHFKESLALFLDMLFGPRFDEGRFSLVRTQAENSIKRRSDSPETLAALGFQSLLYGRDNPWGTYPTLQSLQTISREALIDFHKKFFHPGNMIMGVAGDVATNEVLKNLRSYKGYPLSGLTQWPTPPAKPGPQPGIHVIDKASNQVVFNAGHEGSSRQNPDKYALIVMNHILGDAGSFNSLLPSIIRVEKGLAYSVWSSYQFGPPEAVGDFKIYLSTKTPSAFEALEIVKTVMSQFAEGMGLTEEELIRAKTSILNRLIFEYASPFEVVSSVVRFHYFGFPDNYVELYSAAIDKIQLDDVKNAAKNYLHPDKMQFVLVGDKKILEKGLKDDMKFFDLSIDQ